MALDAVKAFDPEVTPTRLLRLEFQADESIEMALVWLIAHTLLYLWGIRASGKVVERFLTRASLESKISLLRETRFVNETTLIGELVEQYM